MSGTANWLNTLKLRGSYGSVGNEKIWWAQQYTLVNNQENAVLGEEESLLTGASYGVLGNPDLRWETTEQLNIGFDFGMLNDRLTGEVDYYVKTTRDILVGLRSPGHMGSGPFTTTTRNAAKVRNSGLEFQALWRDDLDNGITYQIGGNIATVKNEVLKMARLTGNNSFIADGPLGNGDQVTYTEVGGPIGAYYGFKVDGVFQTQGELDSSPTWVGQQVGDLKFVDINGDGAITTDDRTFLGSPNPDFTYGLNLQLEYKGFDFSAFFYGSQGNNIINQLRTNSMFFGNYLGAKSKELLNAWTPENTNTSIPIIESSGSFSTLGPMNSFFVEDGSYLRLKSIILGYSLEPSKLKRFGMSKLRIYLQATNLFTITKYSGMDPELVGPSASFGIDWGNYPNNFKNFLIGLNISF